VLNKAGFRNNTNLSKLPVLHNRQISLHSLLQTQDSKCAGHAMMLIETDQGKHTTSQTLSGNHITICFHASVQFTSEIIKENLQNKNW